MKSTGEAWNVEEAWGKGKSNRKEQITTFTKPKDSDSPRIDWKDFDDIDAIDNSKFGLNQKQNPYTNYMDELQNMPEVIPRPKY